MKAITYLDNAATTPMDPAVLEHMIPYLSNHYGNPSSSYSIGRESRLAVESARKTIADYLGVRPTTIYFTSGGTESNNTAINAAITAEGCMHIITSPIEHHAVLNAVDHHCALAHVSSSFVKLDEDGLVDLEDLSEQLRQQHAMGIKCMVSLMHANNEVGHLLDIESVGNICRQYGAIFHSDCVQTIGHYLIDLKQLGVHYASASAHKFHGPKGVGILYVSEGTKFLPFIHGGSQERRKRAGTENVHGIVGFKKAFSIAMENQQLEESYIRGLNDRMREALSKNSDEMSFNSLPQGLYSVLSANFPKGSNTDLLLALLDQKGICASGGSACNSAEDYGSHVITALKKELPGATIRFSFSRMTTVEDIDFAVATLGDILNFSSPIHTNY